MCEEGAVHGSVSVLVGGSGSPPEKEEDHTEHYRLLQYRGEVSRQERDRPNHQTCLSRSE